MERLETARLILRPFTQDDAEDLYAYARDPRVGPRAGWPPHGSLEESRAIIRTVFSDPLAMALEWKETGRVVGSAGFVGRHRAELPGPDNEIGYALSPACWGRGLMPEAVEELLRFGFEDLGLAAIWCGHYDFNSQSRRVVEKCGFRYVCTDRIWVEAMGEERTELHYALTPEEWRARARPRIAPDEEGQR